jgi:hypothetical protein
MTKSAKYKFKWLFKRDLKEIAQNEEYNYNDSQTMYLDELEKLFDAGKFDGCVVKHEKPDFIAGYLLYLTKDDHILAIRTWGQNEEVLRMLLDRAVQKLNKKRSVLKVVSYDDELGYHKVFKDYGLRCLEVKRRDWDYKYSGGTIYCDSYVFEFNIFDSPLIKRTL